MVYEDIVENIRVEIRELKEERQELLAEMEEGNEEVLQTRINDIEEDLRLLQDELEGYKNGDLVI